MYHNGIITCMYVYLYVMVCMHVCLYVHMLVCMYVCIHVRTYACMHASMYACLDVWMYVYWHDCDAESPRQPASESLLLPKKPSAPYIVGTPSVIIPQEKECVRMSERQHLSPIGHTHLFPIVWSTQISSISCTCTIIFRTRSVIIPQKKGCVRMSKRQQLLPR